MMLQSNNNNNNHDNNNMHHLYESVDTSLEDICHQQNLFPELGKNKDNDLQITFYCQLKTTESTGFWTAKKKKNSEALLASLHLYSGQLLKVCFINRWDDYSQNLQISLICTKKAQWGGHFASEPFTFSLTVSFWIPLFKFSERTFLFWQPTEKKTRTFSWVIVWKGEHRLMIKLLKRGSLKEK